MTNLNDVNASQLKAINYQGQHLLITAGPGTGKTHTLTHRIAQMTGRLDNGQSILSITFTNKAAREMDDRLHLRLGEEKRRVWVGTFHSFCLKFLRTYQYKTELPNGFEVAAPSDIVKLLARQRWQLSKPEIKKMIENVARLKSSEKSSVICDEIEEYNRVLRNSNYLDYDDLLVETVKLLKNDSVLLERVNKMYPFIFVDEYQDINFLQHELLKLLVSRDNRITAIGDPNQAIYGFRGAMVQFFESFADDFKGAEILNLTENYRSGSTIISASSQVIEKNHEFAMAQLVAKIYIQGNLTLYQARTDKAEAEYVVHSIEKFIGGTSMFSQDSGRVDDDDQPLRSFGDFAVLYRMNTQNKALEEAFHRSGIPYQICGDKPFAEVSPVYEFYQSLKLVYNQDVDMKAVLKLLSCDEFSLLTLIDQIKTGLDNKKISDVINEIQKIPFWKDALKNNPDWQFNIDKLQKLSQKYDSLFEFNDYLSLECAEDVFDPTAERVSLLTLHASKGLEFPVVFIVGCEENILPLKWKGKSTDIEEERRLFYVGMTRAKENLCLTYADTRRFFGQKLSNEPSVFLADIKEDLKTYQKSDEYKKANKPPAAEQMELFS